MENIINISLREALSSLPGDQHIKLGTKYGSGFFWIGKAGDLKETLDTVSDQMHKVLVKAADKEIQIILKRQPARYGLWVAQNLRAYLEDRSAKVITDYYHYQLYRDDFDRKTTEKAEAAKEKIQNAHKFMPLGSRTVADAFKAPDVVEAEDTVNIIISGDESGKWWTTDEQTREKACGAAVGNTAANFGGVVRTPKQDRR